MSDAEFPIGYRIDDWIEIVEHMRGGPERGQYIAALRDGERVLVTMSTRQTKNLGDVFQALAMTADGVATLRDVLPLAHPLGGEHACLVEELPEGLPSTTLSWPLDLRTAARLGLGLCDALEDAHGYGWVLGGVRPELVFVEGDEPSFTEVAPRAERFFTTATPSCAGSPHPFEHLYQAPEMLALRAPEAAADVFSLCAMLATWTDGPPFEGEGAAAQLFAITGERRRPYRGPAAWRALIDGGLSKEPSARPGLDDIRAVLRRS